MQNDWKCVHFVDYNFSHVVFVNFLNCFSSQDTPTPCNPRSRSVTMMTRSSPRRPRRPAHLILPPDPVTGTPRLRRRPEQQHITGFATQPQAGGPKNPAPAALQPYCNLTPVNKANATRAVTSHLYRLNGQLLVAALHGSSQPPPAPASAFRLRQLHLRGKRRGSRLLHARAACAADAPGRLLRSGLLQRSAGRGLRCG